jgi:hypothetical protein
MAALQVAGQVLEARLGQPLGAPRLPGAYLGLPAPRPAAFSRGVRRARRMPYSSMSRRTVLRWAPSSAVTSASGHVRTSSRSARYARRSAKPNSARPGREALVGGVAALAGQPFNSRWQRDPALAQ